MTEQKISPGRLDDLPPALRESIAAFSTELQERLRQEAANHPAAAPRPGGDGTSPAERWAWLCWFYGIADLYQGTNQLAPRGLRNRIDRRFAKPYRRSYPGQSYNRFALTEQQLRASLKPIETELLAFYWGDEAGASRSWRNSATLATLQLTPQAVPSWMQAAADALPYNADITPHLPLLVDLLRQLGVPGGACQGLSIPLERRSDALLPYLAGCAAEELHPAMQYRSFARSARSAARAGKPQFPYAALLTAVYFGSVETMAAAVYTPVAPEVIAGLTDKDQLVQFVRDRVVPNFGYYPSYTQLREHWRPASGEPSAGMLYKRVCAVFGKWRALADEADLNTNYLRDRRPSREETIRRYLALVTRFGRPPTQQEVNRADGALVGHINEHFGGMKPLYKVLGIRRRRGVKCDDGKVAESYGESRLYNRLLAVQKSPDSSVKELEMHAMVNRCGRPSKIDFLLNNWLIVELEMEDSSRPDLAKHPTYVPIQAKKIADLVASGHTVLRVQQVDIEDAKMPATITEILQRLHSGPVSGKVTAAFPAAAQKTADTNRKARPIGYWTSAQIVASLRDAADDDRIVRLTEASKRPELRGLRDALSRLDRPLQSEVLARARVRLSSPNWFHPLPAVSGLPQGKMLSRIGQACLIRVLRHTRGILPGSSNWPDSYSAGLPNAMTKEFGSLRALAGAAGLAWFENGLSVVRVALSVPITKEPGFNLLEKAISAAQRLQWRFGHENWQRLRAVLTALALGGEPLVRIRNPWQDSTGALLPDTVQRLGAFLMHHGGKFPPRDAWEVSGLDALRAVIVDSELGHHGFCDSIDIDYQRVGGEWVQPSLTRPEPWMPPASWPVLGTERRNKH